jgi:integrase
VPLDAVSRMLRHRTTKTTETYYARRTNEAAILEAQKIWDRQPKPFEINSPLIDKRIDRTGYA